MAKYINRFQSESVRCYLIPQIVSDRVKDCERLAFELYVHFKNSKEYISSPGEPSPAHIYVRYDNAFKALKLKRMKHEPTGVVSNPRDAFYLTLTVRMLASWKIPELEQICFYFLDGSCITNDSLGLPDQDTNYYRRHRILNGNYCSQPSPVSNTIRLTLLIQN